MEGNNDKLLEDNVEDDNSNSNEGSCLPTIKDVSKMSIVQKNYNIKTNNAILFYLNQYAEYFQSVSKDFLFKHGACCYLKNAEAIIIKEMDKIELDIDTQTRIEYANIMKTEFIVKNVKTIVEMENFGVVYMLKNNQNDDLKSMYNCLRSANSGVKVMFDGMRPYFREVGTSVVLGNKGNSNTCIQELLDLKGKFDNLMVNLFNNDPLFDKTVGYEFDYFLNLNSLIPKYLSIFIDEKLRKGKHTYIKNNPEADIDKIIYMIKYLKNKDAFEYCYQTNLCNRLLHCKSVSIENEKKMIDKIKNAYTNGHGTKLFISKLKGMIEDKLTSKLVMKNYNDWVEINECIFGISKSFDFDIDVQVITSINWPVDPNSIHEIPSFGLSAFNEFKKIYKQNNAKKKLMILPQFGTVELKGIFYGKPCSNKQLVNEKRDERKIKLVVTTYQMCVLNLFNDHNTLTFEEIQRKTQIPKDSLIEALHDMMEHGNYLQYLLLKTPIDQEIMLTDTFYVNESFEYM